MVIIYLVKIDSLFISTFCFHCFDAAKLVWTVLWGNRLHHIRETSWILDDDLHIRLLSYTDQNPEHHFKYQKKCVSQYLPRVKCLDKSHADNAYPFCYFLNEAGKVLNWRLLWINIKKVPSALIRMVLQDMDDSVVLSAPGLRSFVIIIDNTKVTLNMMKSEGEHYHLESSLNIVARKHMCSDCLSINYDELQKNQCPTPNDSFWRNLPSHLTPCHLFWLHVLFTPIKRTL